MQPSQANRVLEFGDFELDVLRRVLVSRESKQPVEITGRVMEALVYFVERPGELVEKKALMDALWPHVVVEDGNLTQTIHTLRRVLGEKPGEHRYIATVPGRGYRFVAEVRAREPEVITAAAEPAIKAAREPAKALAWAAVAFAFLVILVFAAMAWRGRAQLTGAPAAPVASAAPVSIAVLPFVDMSTSQDQEHFADGLSEEILNLLAHADSLRVIARTSSFSFKDQNADIHTIAQRLSVTHVLEGSVRKEGDRVRVTAQLVDGKTSAHVWSETYDRDLHDIFGVQREIAVAVADALHVTLRRPTATRAETDSTEAYEHYLQGRHLFNRRSGTDLVQAKAHFEKAVQLDPEFARAWAALSGVYLVARYEQIDLPDAKEKWQEAANRAAALGPDLAEAQVRAGQFYWHNGDEKTARALIKRAKELDPHEPLLTGISVSHAISDGRLEEAIEIQKKMVANDPLSATNPANLGHLLMAAGRFTEAQAELERALELSPASINTMSAIADVLILQDRLDEASTVVAKMPESYMRDERIALIHFARDEVSEGEAALARLQKFAEKRPADFDIAISVAEVYARRNDVERAFEWIDKANRGVERQTGTVVRWMLYDTLRLAPYLKPLQADPRWEKLRPPGSFTE